MPSPRVYVARLTVDRTHYSEPAQDWHAVAEAIRRQLVALGPFTVQSAEHERAGQYEITDVHVWPT